MSLDRRSAPPSLKTVSLSPKRLPRALAEGALVIAPHIRANTTIPAMRRPTFPRSGQHMALT